MTVDMHEYKFILELQRLPHFEPAASIDPDVRAVDFPAWRALFSSQLLWGHSTAYRLPSFEEFWEYCRRAYSHPQHGKRFHKWFSDQHAGRTRQRVRFWYESGMAETYLYVCLVDVFEDILKNGIVLYDARADWKQKWDVAVISNNAKIRVDAFWGEPEARDTVEERRDLIERDRKAATSISAHWGNQERLRWTELRIHRSDDDCQEVNGIRLFSIANVNGLLSQIYVMAGIDAGFYFPIDEQGRQRLYRSLVGKASGPQRSV